MIDGVDREGRHTYMRQDEVKRAANMLGECVLVNLEHMFDMVSLCDDPPEDLVRVIRMMGNLAGEMTHRLSEWNKE